jgi:hypothetical protein
MGQPTQIKAQLEAAKSSDHTGVGAAYSPLGSPLSNAAQSLIITSTFNDGAGNPISVWISTDGATDQLLVPGYQFSPLAISANKQSTGMLSFAKGTQFYIKQGPDGAPAGGDFSLTAIYGR